MFNLLLQWMVSQKLVVLFRIMAFADLITIPLKEEPLLNAAQRWVLVVGLGIIGGCIGSFMNVVMYRWPRGMSVSNPKRSHCPACNHLIRPWHNLPVLGWIILRGKCYDCGSKFSIKYPLYEALYMIVFAALAYYFLQV